MFDLQTGRRWLPVSLAAAGLVVLSACGGGGDAAPVTEPSAAPATAAAPQEAFAECMTQQGVPAPGGGTRITGPGGAEPGQQDGQQGGQVTRRNAPPPPDGVEPEAWEAALEACGHLAPRRTPTPTPTP